MPGAWCVLLKIDGGADAPNAPWMCREQIRHPGELIWDLELQKRID
jgi:hypothetical protein